MVLTSLCSSYITVCHAAGIVLVQTRTSGLVTISKHSRIQERP